MGHEGVFRVKRKKKKARFLETFCQTITPLSHVRILGLRNTTRLGISADAQQSRKLMLKA